ncbi:integrase core domain-containing protein [Campylobacter hyointestinalis]|uniref:integrase core domain-containing protein n=1 Tax=Campylobacter hyointestinalis TaxID=198 RepID=UPI001BD3718E|nr:integrase core domain-containing protein [Campylobacter hyointestinalis]MDY2999445.1 integrase core domain-containing protein [Campylobacter hyointestinalis]
MGIKLPSVSSIGRIISCDKDKMRVIPLKIDRNGKAKKITRNFKDRKPKNLKSEPFKNFALDTIQIVNNGIRRYILTMINIDTRVAYAMALPCKHTRYTALGLKALISGMRMCSSNNNNSNANSYDNHKISLLTDNGSEFALHFKDVVKEHNLTHYFTYPRSPKMNAYNERFNRTIKDMFISYNEDLLFTDINEFNRLYSSSLPFMVGSFTDINEFNRLYSSSLPFIVGSFTDINEFNRQMAKWLIDYNTVLPHTSLGYKTPIEYAIMRDKKCNMYWTCAKSIKFSFILVK